MNFCVVDAAAVFALSLSQVFPSKFFLASPSFISFKCIKAQKCRETSQGDRKRTTERTSMRERKWAKWNGNIYDIWNDCNVLWAWTVWHPEIYSHSKNPSERNIHIRNTPAATSVPSHFRYFDCAWCYVKSDCNLLVCCWIFCRLLKVDVGVCFFLSSFISLPHTTSVSLSLSHLASLFCADLSSFALNDNPTATEWDTNKKIRFEIVQPFSWFYFYFLFYFLFKLQ